jgi:hypothetical protein
MAALSAQAPTRPIDPCRPAARRARAKAWERNWLPRSECTTVLVGRPSATALARASTGGRGRRQDAAGRPTRRPAGPSARRDGPHHPRRAAQCQVNGAPGEVPGFQPLLRDLVLTGTVVTANALHTHGDAAEFLVTRKYAHYLFTVKANQPTLLDRCVRLPWQQVPVLDRTRDRAHGPR